eukprot:gene831-1618_t
MEESRARNTVLLSTSFAVIGFILTNSLVPVVAQYTLRRGICGRDLCKKGTRSESKDIPEALGLAAAVVYLILAIFSQLLFATTLEQLTIYNSALFSICFMTFLGFTDDILDLKWRYKLILPSVASLPLLAAYSGSTSLYVPPLFQSLFMVDGSLTSFGAIINMFIIVDTQAHGAIIELGFYFLIFMGLLAVFCTNAINILAGINGLECGQSYIIACSILFFKLYESTYTTLQDNQIFAIVMILPFIGTALGLLRHNWYPAEIFIGDTFCYFAGMTFAVIAIHGHFSKTLLLLFIPQIFNFLYSIPQLFHLIPCPRHRLPKLNLENHLLQCSTFPCSAEKYKLFKVKADDLECPNCTLICFVLRIFGPMQEKSLTLTLLCIQLCCTSLAFYVRYVLVGDNNTLSS